MATATINTLILSRECEAWFNGQNVAAPIVRGSVSKVAPYIVAHGEQVIRVEFRTVSDPKAMAQDLKTYGRRLAKLAIESGYSAGEFAQVQPGAVIFRTTMTRNS